MNSGKTQPLLSDTQLEAILKILRSGNADCPDLQTETYQHFIAYHKIGGLLFDRLKDSDDAKAALKNYNYQNRIYNLTYIAELKKICEALEAEGIRSVPYKGPVLSWQLYGDFNLRQSEDIDLMIPPEDRQAAFTILESLDYKADPLPANKNFWLKQRHEHTFRHAGEKDVTIELHWRSNPIYFSFNFPVSQIIARSQPVQIENVELRVPDPELNYLLCAVHAARNQFMRLCWVIDLYAFAKNHEMDWQKVLADAEKYGALNIVLLSLRLIQKIDSDIKIPPAAHELPAELTSCMDEVWKFWKEMPEPPPPPTPYCNVKERLRFFM